MSEFVGLSSQSSLLDPPVPRGGDMSADLSRAVSRRTAPSHLPHQGNTQIAAPPPQGGWNTIIGADPRCLFARTARR